MREERDRPEGNEPRPEETEPQEPTIVGDPQATRPMRPPTPPRPTRPIRRIADDRTQARSYQPPTRRQPPYPPYQPPRYPPPPGQYYPPGRRRRGFWASLPFLIMALFTFLGLLVFALMLASMLGYVYIARQLPPAHELWGRSLSFASTQIYDRDGGLLYEVVDPQGGRRTRVPLERTSIYLQQATIATEDRYFYQNPGFDPIGIVRAIWQNVNEREIVSGASTITQQLARSVLLEPQERNEKTLSRKIKEVILAAEITRRYSKKDILELYLNQIYYGNLAYGIEAAAQTYFGKSAVELNLAESALLAGLPQSPTLYDPYVNADAARRRQEIVLGLMVEAGYITPQEAEAARGTYTLNPSPPTFAIRAPHFVMYVRQILEEQYGPEVLYRAGLKVTTTLDPRLQTVAEEVARQHIAALRSRNAGNAALVAIHPDNGQIAAMLGSVDFFDPAIDGQVNVALRLRQPGSAIKPVTYAAAFEKGWTPATLIMDVPTSFPDGANPPYEPQNYDERFRGPVLVRSALANSLNVPAVKTLQFVTLPTFLEMAHRLGIASLDKPYYGLSVTLGGGDVTLLELTGAYTVLANGGRRVPPVAILEVRDSEGRIVQKYTPPQGAQVISPQYVYLITNILSDDAARAPIFGANSVLKLSRPAAVKTGTTNDYRDSWTVGYTPDLVTGVWVGNADNSPMARVPGSAGAALIWHDFMERALDGTPVSNFVRPPGIVDIEICADSGTRPGPYCPQRKMEIFAADHPPLGPEHDMHQMVRIDKTTGLRATDDCPDEYVEERYYVVYPQEGREWAEKHGIEQPPLETSCPVQGGVPPAVILGPAEGEHIQGVTTIYGRASMPDFAGYVVEFGIGHAPEGWGQIAGPITEEVHEGPLAEWDTRDSPNGPYTIRVRVGDNKGNVFEAQVHVVIDNPPTAEPPTPTPEPLPPTGTPLPPPTNTPLPPTPTGTPEPPTPTDTLQPPTPTGTPEPPTPTNTPQPPTPTNTPEPPTLTNTPQPPTPTNTPEPPTPTDTPQPPTPTDTPLAAPTAAPGG
jgi:1A family penicillin-binding protein